MVKILSMYETLRRLSCTLINNPNPSYFFSFPWDEETLNGERLSIGRIVIWDSQGDLHSQLVFKFRQSLLIKSLTEKSLPNLYIILTAMLFNRFIQTMQIELCFLSIQSNLKIFFILCSSLLDWTCKERFSSFETLKLAFGKLSWESHCEGGAKTNSSMKTSKETISNKVVLHWKATCTVQIEFNC